MTTNDWLAVGITIIGAIALLGIFFTKTAGFGKFTTSLLLLVLVLFVSSLFFATGKIETSVFTNILFSIAGFAGGLITNKD
jgi:hypothetical protein